MKRILVIVLAFLVLLPFASLALTIDLETATIDELLAAQLEISAQLSVLRANNAPVGEDIVLIGSGTSIKSGISIPFSPARLTITGEAKVTFTDGDNSSSFSSEGLYAGFIYGTVAETSALIEAQGDWTITIEQIKEGASLPLEGEGSFISDFFDLPEPIIVTVEVDATDLVRSYGWYEIRIRNQYEYSDSWDYNTLDYDSIDKGVNQSVDLILKPVKGRMQYCITVEAPAGLKWSITPKN
jgi:hypothetical protein